MQKNKQPVFYKKNTPGILIFLKRHSALTYLLKWFLACLLTGICAGTAAAFFLHSLDWITNFREDHKWVIAFLPVGGLAVGLLYHYKGKEVEAGNNLVIETINDPQRTVPFRMAPFVYLGTIITHFFGGSAGREGTAIQMSGAIADQFSKPLKFTKDDRKILMIAAVAAGFGSIFGTPLAGAVFGLEVCIAGRIQLKAVIPAFTAAFIADEVTRLCQAHHTSYHIGIIPSVSLLSILYAVAAGIAFGVCAFMFTKGMHSTSSLFRSLIKYPPLRPVIGGIIVAAAVFALGTTKYIGLGIPTILQSFSDHLPAYDFLLKMAFTIITLSAGFKGGEVTPLFFIGAVVGNALSYFVPLPMGLLAGMGFVAVFAGATNTPIACTIMAMELFGPQCGIFVAVACAAAYFFSGSKSIYQAQRPGGKLSRYYSFRTTADMREL